MKDPFDFSSPESPSGSSRGGNIHGDLPRSKGAFDFLDEDPQTDTHVERIPARPSRLRRFGRAALAATAGAGLLAGGAFAYNEFRDTPRESNQTVTEQASTVNEIVEVPYTFSESAPSKELVAEFQSVFEASTCDTPETPLASAEVYHEVFEAFNPPSMSDAEILGATSAVLDRLSEARNKSEFLALPANYHELLSDAAQEHPAIPLFEYQSALESILTPLKTEVVYHWDDSDTNTVTKEGPFVSPLDPATLESSPLVKQAIVGTISAYAGMPKSTIDLASPQKIYFGNLLNANTLALATHAEIFGFPIRNTFVDASTPDDPRVILDSGKFRSAVAHEASHHRELAICKATIDQAWNNLNPDGFTYSKEAMDQLTSQSHLPGTDITTLEHLNRDHENQLQGRAVTAEPYGNSSSREDYATLIGEFSLDPTNTDQLFTDPESSQTLYKKLAIDTARMEQYDPVAAEFYRYKFMAAALEQELNERFVQANTATVDYLSDPDNAADYSETQTLPPDVQAAQDHADRLLSSAVRLHEAQTGISSPQKGGVIESDIGTAVSD